MGGTTMRSWRLVRGGAVAALALVFAITSLLWPAGGSATAMLHPRTPAAIEPAALVGDILPAGVNVGLFFEIGYTVTDIDAAMAQFGDGMGIEWYPVQAATLNVRLANGQVTPVDFQFATSVSGPPYIELVQASGAGNHPWRATPHGSPIHLGYAVTDLAAAADALVAAGFPQIATVDVPGMPTALFSYHRGPGDIMIELVDPSIVPPGVCDPPGSPWCAVTQ
ncbi:MAG TPA: VOC family protein [Micromonosporaceae bacterium]